ncbi:MAG TPA: MiaB/RimO family radical SAM methylthiotransferase [Gemmatimonadaceae bacterium]
MKLYLRTFGCRANQYDSETVRAMVEAQGGEIVGAVEDADVAVFNSCAVTADAVADLRQQVRGAARRNEAVRSVVMGCAAGLGGSARASIAALPTVQAIVPGVDLDAIARAIGFATVRAVPAARQSGARALLRIQDGCDEHCTFCATTIVRGAHRSRDANAIVAEASALAEHHSEIVLTGVHIGGWGRELGTSLGALLERLVGEVPHVRFRLTSIEATEVDERLAELLTGAPGRVAPHLHAPLQSGSDRLLKRMGRHWYTARRYAAAIERIAAAASIFALGGDVITGFPGEGDDDHEATVALVRSLPFTSLHVFPYSARPDTAAERLPQLVSGRVSRARAAELRDLAALKAEAHVRSRLGGQADVVVIRDGDAPRGLTEDYLDVALEGATPARSERFAATLALRDRTLIAEARAPLAG